MSSQEESADVGRVLAFLREWDRGDNTVRSRILKTFLTQSSEKTFYQLECEFAQISSLFLARLTTWMRLTYPFCSAFIATVFFFKMLTLTHQLWEKSVSNKKKNKHSC